MASVHGNNMTPFAFYVTVVISSLFLKPTTALMLGQWSSFSPCTSLCDGGTQTRTRTRSCVDEDTTDETTCEGVSTTDTRICSEGIPCPPTWDQWSSFSPCTSICDGGTQTRTRSCVDDDTTDEMTCEGESTDTRNCNVGIPCLPMWDSWSAYSSCTSTCVGGEQTRTRSCEDDDIIDEMTCEGESTETIDCNLGVSCPPMWGLWGAYSLCTSLCDGGTQARTRSCVDDDTTDEMTCEGESMETRNCNAGISCLPTWSSWGEFALCTSSCDGGTQTRTRPCVDYDTTDEIICESDQSTETRNCNGNIPCSPMWGSWGEFATCTLSCFGGTQTRTRTCVDDDTTDEMTCEGAQPTETRNCNAGIPCLPMWGEWSEFAICTSTCDGGTQTRTRSCVDENTTDGITCEVNLPTEIRNCNTGITCLPMWGSWGAFSVCTSSCNGGTQTRTRSCVDDDTTDEILCESVPPTEIVNCNAGVPCSPMWGSWGEFSVCTSTCDGGTQLRTRSCEDDDTTNERTCVGELTETRNCNVGISCYMCIPGEFSATGYSPCGKCEPGTVQLNPGSEFCHPCYPGTHQPIAGQTKCLPCPIGFFQQSEGNRLCISCPTGSFQPSEGRNRCVPCPTGFFQSVEGSSQCLPCPAGFYQPTTGNSDCTPCEVGFFQSSSGATACISCPGRQSTAQLGSTSDADCQGLTDAAIIAIGGSVVGALVIFSLAGVILFICL